MMKIRKVQEQIEKTVVGGYKKIEDGVVSGYMKIQHGAVNGYNKVADKCIEKMFTKEGETVEEAKVRMGEKR